MNPRLTITAAVATILVSVALHSLVHGALWFWTGAATVVVVAGASAAARLRRLPAAPSFLVAIAAEFVFLNDLFAGNRSFAGLVPTPASVHHLRLLLKSASAEISRYAPPVPAGHGIVLVTAAGIGFVAAITDLLAVRLRRPAVAGLPLLMLFSAPITTDVKTNGVATTLVFCLGMAGYLALLSADGRERLRLWGRLVNRWQGETEGRAPDVKPLTAAGRRIGSAAVVLAVCVPLLIPGLRQHRLFGGTGGLGGPGGSNGNVALPNPLVGLNQQLKEAHPRTVLTYKTTDPQPPYLQVYVLSQLGSNVWSMTAPRVTDLRNGELPAVPGLAPGIPGNSVQETIALQPGLTTGGQGLSYLPLPYAARKVSVGGAWRVSPADLTVMAAGAQLGGMHYSVTADDVNPAAAQIRGAPEPVNMGSFLSVPKAYQSLLGLARKLTATRTSSYGKAIALQQWFTQSGNFHYSLKVPATTSANSLVQFLTKTKEGYCQQFAFGFAVLARLLGIPSRVVVGYTQGTYLANNVWVVKTSDAHSWPELYFPHSGWLRFEPTPIGSAGHPGQGTATTPSYSVPVNIGVNSPGPTVVGPGGVATGPLGQNEPNSGKGGSINKLIHPPPAQGPASVTKKVVGAAVTGWTLLVLLVLLLIAPGTSRVIIRRVRWWRARDDAWRAHTAWQELRDDLSDHRVAWTASETPRTLARRVAEALGISGEARQALERVALAEERATYASSPVDSATLRRDAVAARRAVARSRRLPVRLSAALLPASVLVPARAGLQQALDVFGWLDVIVTKVRSRTPAGARREQIAMSLRD